MSKESNGDIVQVHISGHAWERYRKRYPEKTMSREALREHINSNTKKEDKQKAFRSSKEKLLRCENMFIPVSRSGDHLIAKTIIPSWMMRKDATELQARINSLENILWNYKYNRKKRIKKLIDKIKRKFKHKGPK